MTGTNLKLHRLLVSVAALLVITCAGRPSGYNLLLVSFDTTRADRIGCYGYSQPTSPHLDSLAARSVRFEHAYTPTPITLPAHTSLLTGVYPTSHGVRSNGIFSLRPGIGILAESFRAAGYATAAFVGAFVLDSRYGLARGFDRYDDDMITGGKVSGVLGQRERTAGVVTDRALEWLRSESGRPWFAFVHFFDPHRPWEAPAEFSGRFDDPYDAEIAYADSQLGRLLSALDSLGMAANTVVVVLADHGEGLGEHGENTHANFIYNSTLHVPLVVHVPGRAAALDSSEVSLVDVAPTVAALCGVAPLSGCQGRVLLAAGGENPGSAPPLYAECYYPYYSHGWSPLEGVVHDGFKYIRAPRPELYDLVADPGELHNLLGSDPARSDRYRDLLTDFRARITPQGGTPSARARAMSAGEQSRLQSLGYVGGTHRAPPPDFSSLPDPKDMIATFGAYMLGVTYMADGRLDLAAAEFRRILAEDSTNYSVWEFLSETELQRGNQAAAESAARRAAAAPEPSERAWFCLGMSLLVRGDSAGAAAMMKRTLEINRDYGPALAVQARILDGGGRRDEALDFYARALEAMPENAELMTDYGSCLLALGRLKEAEKYLSRAADLSGGAWRPWFDLGVARQKQGDTAGAVEAYRTAAADSSAPAAVHNNLGICLFAQGEYKQSGYAYVRALELEPEYAEAWNNLAGSLAAQGKIENASIAYNRALEIQPDYVDACFNYGVLLAERLELPDSALALIRRGIELAPDSPRARTMAAFAGKLRL